MSFKIAFTGWDTANKYQVSNNSGQQVFYAMESEYNIFDRNKVKLSRFIRLMLKLGFIGFYMVKDLSFKNYNSSNKV